MVGSTASSLMEPVVSIGLTVDTDAYLFSLTGASRSVATMIYSTRLTSACERASSAASASIS